MHDIVPMCENRTTRAHHHSGLDEQESIGSWYKANNFRPPLKLTYGSGTKVALVIHVGLSYSPPATPHPGHRALWPLLAGDKVWD